MQAGFSRWIDLPDEATTCALAGRLALLARPGDVYALEGDLGSGKTTWARAFIRALTDPEEEVPSPTFTLVQTYETASLMIWHFDLYRLERSEEIGELGIEDAFDQGISLIEWPDRLGAYLPSGRLTVHLQAGEGLTARRALVSGGEAWRVRVEDILGAFK